ncbi:MerR family transcriptional regulator [Bacillus sp. PK3_68]|uniref:MerR family transcriptional regulator n=1 Tax=Bacillus sp. PK3_68 TaxID=2027408 RepID=UPI001602D54E|nr:MerR family transcriptional regulator [Bacillus sp. PK3_68]
MAKTFTIGQFKKMSGLTARTLQYYDEIGLLAAKRTSSGHRYYQESDLWILQKIVSLKFLGFSLEEIADFIRKDTWNEKDSLIFQRDLMEKKREQLNDAIRLLSLAIDQIERGGTLHTDIFVSMINNVQMEDDHKSWMKSVVPSPYIDELFDRIKNNQEEIEKRAMDLFSRIKELAFSDPKSSAVEQLVTELIELAAEVAGGDFHTLETYFATDLEEDPWLFPYPFSPEEEKWLEQAMTYYKEKEE